MITKKKIYFSPIWVGMLSLLGATAWANEPTPPQVMIDFSIKAGATGVVLLENREKLPVSLSFFPGDLGTIVFEKFSVQLAPQQRTEIKLAKVSARPGRQVLHLQSSATLGEARVDGPSVYQPYFISTAGEGKKMSYEEAFLAVREKIEGKSDQAKIDLGGASDVSEINRLAFKANAIPAGFKIEPFSLRGVQDYAKMPIKQLPKNFEVGGNTPNSSSMEDGAMEGEDSWMSETDRSFSENLIQPESVSPFANLIKGHMSLKTGPSTYKAAWGWVVRAWQQVGGIWIFQGWTYVNGDGSWSISLPSVLPGIPVRIEYRTKNRFVSVQDPAGNAYTWGDNWNLTGATTDIGYRYADLTTNGDLPAVDRLYVGATNIWVKFYNNGMNALRDNPIEVTFPNALSSGKCIYNNGSGPYAWSCSYWGDGKIYIIPAHGSASVVQHEIAHSINSYYWDGNMPPGSGGSHNLWDCYNNGLALTEGFANFVTYWTQFERNNSNPIAAYFNMNMESLPSGVCANQTAEMRVASTFWDMYDTINDGSGTAADGLNYVNQAVPVSIYLGNKRNSMAEYLPVVKAGQSAFWQEQFTKLFRLGKIIP